MSETKYQVDKRRHTDPCGCQLEGCVVVKPCTFCAGMTASMDREAAALAKRQPGHYWSAE